MDSVKLVQANMPATAGVPQFEQQIMEEQEGRSSSEWTPDTSMGKNLIGMDGGPQAQGVSRPSVAGVNQPSMGYGGGGGSGMPPAPYKYDPSSEMKKRLDPQYQAIVSHFQSTREKAWSVSDAEIEKLVSSSPDKFNQVEQPLRNLYDGAENVSLRTTFVMQAGSKMIAVLDQDVNSDFPGVFTATVVRPFEVKGSKLICQGSGNKNDRIDVQVLKLVSTSQKEVILEGQVQMQYPGITGAVTSHWLKRMGPSIANAAIGGALLAATATQGNRVNTQDVIVGPIVEQSVTGLQNEITRFGGDHPNTVVARQGTQFEVLLVKEIAIR